MLDKNTYVIFYFYRDMSPLIDYMVGQREDVKRKVMAEVASDPAKDKARVFGAYSAELGFAYNFSVDL